MNRLELPVEGMDCAGCARHVREAIAAVPGVCSVEVLLSTEKAIIELERKPDLVALRRAVEQAGYRVPEAEPTDGTPDRAAVGRRALLLLGMVFGVVLFAAVAGEWLGLFSRIEERIPFSVGLVLVLVIGYPVFLNVLRAALRGKVISHTLMAVGAIAALLVGQWTTAALVVFFMRVGDYAEQATTERARQSVRALSDLAPKMARLVRDGIEIEMPIDQVRAGDLVVVRPGEAIPVDGVVEEGHATIDQSSITGESMPVEAGAGTRVFAATMAGQGSLRVRAQAAGRDATFGQIIEMVEQAEARRGPSQRLADRFSAWYLPVVAGIAVLTYLVRQDLMATVAVMVVACSCAFALATPVAMLASIGAAARRGLLIKGGKYVETLAGVDVVLLDKTGTLTLGRPRITDVVTMGRLSEDELLQVAAAAERDSEHPLGAAVRELAAERALPIPTATGFEAIPGRGVRADVGGREVRVGTSNGVIPAGADVLRAQGKSILLVEIDGRQEGVLGASDVGREGVAEAIRELQALGIRHIEMLTGDHRAAAALIARQLGISFRSDLLPADKIRVVEEYQQQGHTVMMIGDGVNDAPALAQADIGVAMGAAGSPVALHAAHAALLRDDWQLVPELFRVARRTMSVVRLNLGFTTVYNMVGLTLAAMGILPPVLAAAAQSLPDLGIMANSARLIRK